MRQSYDKSQITRSVNVFSTHKKTSNPKERENLETVIEGHEKVIEKLELKRINEIKELKEVEAIKKELEELEIEKINEAISNIPKEILLQYFLRYVFQLIKKVSEKSL